MNQNGMTASREVSRRTVVKAGAWAVPVVAAAVALPMAAASGGTVVWPSDPSENGSEGTVNYTNATNELSGREEAYYLVEVSGTGTATLPPLTATFTTTGAWMQPVTFATSNGGAALTVGQTLSGRQSLVQWTVVSITADTVVLAAAPQPIPAGTSQRLATPRLWAYGSGDTAVGGQAAFGVVLSGGSGAVTGSNGSTVSVA